MALRRPLLLGILTIQFDRAVGVAQGVLGHAAIGSEVLQVHVAYGQSHGYFVARLKGFRHKALT